MSEVRSFVAVPLPVPIQGAIFEAARALSAHVPGMRWSRKPENLHVTLSFLGQIEEEALARFGGEIESLLAPVPAFPIALRGFGAFPSARQAGVVWAGVDDPSGSLERIASDVERLADRLGFRRAQKHTDEHTDERGGFRARSRPFRGHVTVARSAGREPRNTVARLGHHRGTDVRAALEPWSEHRFGEIWVGEVHLYESILGGDGSTYVLRGMATLEGAIHGDVRQG